MNTPLLDRVKTPADIKKMDYRQLERLCSEIRGFLVENVCRTGGHLSSNLGVVELTVALHYVLHSPKDMIVFDVGHQCYTHKLLTGRRAGFADLRGETGVAGFPAPRESEHDVFIAGHASTSLSAAIGLAQAKRMRGEEGLVVAIIGDGAFTGGMPYEALNNVGELTNLLVILNDNQMSISKNETGLGRYLSTLRTSPEYNRAKHEVKQVLHSTPLIGEGLVKGIQTVKRGMRRSLYHSTFFEEMGFGYIGPLNGHDIPQLCNVLGNISQIGKPMFVHVETVKGKGYRPAEQNPGAFHGVPAVKSCNEDPDVSPGDSFSTVFGRTLVGAADGDGRICAITAAMKYGTGLQYFKKAHRNRFFDVGIAEEHAVTFAAGLAKNGMLPVVSLYSTFLQRAYDQFIHDVTLQQLNVLFAVDRAGLVPGDGETHQGVYDAAFLSQQRAMTVISPCNYAELTYWLERLLTDAYTKPRAIRFPRGEQPARLADKPCSGALYDELTHMDRADAALVTYGVQAQQALEAADLLAERQIDAQVVQMVQINPIPDDLVEKLVGFEAIVFSEEGVVAGGIGEHLLMKLYQKGFCGSFVHKGVPETGIDHASVPQLKKRYGLDAQSLADAVALALGGAK